MTIKFEIRRGAYHDSAVLMQLQRGLLALPGVRDSGAVMATPANLELVAQSGMLLDEAKQASPNDLLIVVKADDESSAAHAIQQIEPLLSKRTSSLSGEYRVKTLESAVKQAPDANWVLISTPGKYAAGIARDALNFGKHVFLYSDNVSLSEEIELKKHAAQKGLLVMGPDCGTAIINGVGLGFANRVRRGLIGVIGASGTGLQAVTARIHELGAGVSHAIGTGGRDLKSDVGAITMRMAFEALARDEATQAIVLISKPPSARVVTRLLSMALACAKPVIVNFIGFAAPARQIGNVHFAASLSEAADLAVSVNQTKSQSSVKPSHQFVRGIFSGGTLAYETLLGLSAFLSPIYSNSPLNESQRLKDSLHSEAHSIVDMGEDEFMVGRLHPMIDNDLRIRRLRQEAADPQCGLLLLDVVLGEGAHADPASELAPVIAECIHKRAGTEFEVGVLVVGTDADPQNMTMQIEAFKQAGARVYHTVTEAVEHIARQYAVEFAADAAPIDLAKLNQPVSAINVGLESFHASLLSQGAQSLHVEWRPPAAGNERMAALLAKMKKS